MRVLAEIYERNPVGASLVGMVSSLFAPIIGMINQIDLIKINLCVQIAGGLIGSCIGLLTLGGWIHSRWKKRNEPDPKD